MRLERGPRVGGFVLARVGCTFVVIFGGVLVSSALVGGATMTWVQRSRQAPDAAAVAAAMACPAVTNLLGRPIHRGLEQDFGSEDESSGGCDVNDYGLSLVGPQGEGYARYLVRRKDERWVVEMMAVETDAGRVIAVPCEASVPIPAPAGRSRKHR